ncbi:PepSY-like domain-containing protein [Parabacteroides sp. PF5-9]|uniref:PepSY-like domain-containing protein n=1 Tax=Parabacteroides sp. PF5-9 TaxID=1742404 RepID=UPI00247566A3|nr:PepSY-like domain-containing protein [Parabacteroides sp. PF5-9]MDH6357187.1 hypothetical protein [Parabacteroides sp. PF5-9]
MMKKRTFFMAIFMAGILFFSCDKGVDNEMPPGENPSVITPTNEVLRNFEIIFPDIEDVLWSINTTYYVADFVKNKKSISAWFKIRGDWVLTKSDLNKEELNQFIRNTFSNSKYSRWQVNKVSLLEREGFSDLFIINTNKNNRYASIYYATNGTQVRINNGANYTDTPIEVPSDVMRAINHYFQDPDILDLWGDITQTIKVAVLENDQFKLLILDEEFDFLYMITSIEAEDVPEVIMKKFKASRYGKYVVNDIREMKNDIGVSYLFYFDDEEENNNVATVSESTDYIVLLKY